MEQPVYHWAPVVVAAGIAFYSGKQSPEWKGNLFGASPAGVHLIWLILDGNRVISEGRLLLDYYQRIEDVAENPCLQIF